MTPNSLLKWKKAFLLSGNFNFPIPLLDGHGYEKGQINRMKRFTKLHILFKCINEQQKTMHDILATLSNMKLELVKNKLPLF